ncbi:MAG: hypothetical protein SAL07_23180 [Oscillatoria sp. PMC 1051.18]|uniref:hypothetical protein n=1 Tax=Oscillatoria salina TaxID=331517 RepID=UPI0013BCC318|nr:hypothetical protein [Oscillatoria salina]MBZ8179332.1 hypothetical protein [Oscillatoria salina IIICB1]MEC4894359.1 hypothetical protein [Oscillatoria sp. PMC 1050.18]MEC5032816.1 hypothetical protein [Oscillatoria sp. PMC 1051.18]NET87634.1 hypothetical protein [Kamptonema sp. SIO1D9]
MLQKSTYQTLGIIDQAIQRFLQKLNPNEILALGDTSNLQAELRQVERNGKIEIRPVVVIECEGKAHRYALLCLKSRLCAAATAVGIPSICLSVNGASDIGFFCD